MVRAEVRWLKNCGIPIKVQNHTQKIRIQLYITAIFALESILLLRYPREIVKDKFN
jgi:hypothetical protein